MRKPPIGDHDKQPVFGMQIFKDVNGNYFVQVDRRDGGVLWSATYSVVKESISDALDRLREHLPLEIL